MDRYPEHRFVASQAQQFYWLEKDYPQLFKKIKGRVESGEFQPIGATWVEMDTNMPSGGLNGYARTSLDKFRR